VLLLAKGARFTISLPFLAFTFHKGIFSDVRHGQGRKGEAGPGVSVPGQKNFRKKFSEPGKKVLKFF
jgi:hypothetical protein